jgi:hypothetical protein
MIIIRSKTDNADTYLFDEAADAVLFMVDKQRKDYTVYVTTEFNGAVTVRRLEDRTKSEA